MNKQQLIDEIKKLQDQQQKIRMLLQVSPRRITEEVRKELKIRKKVLSDRINELKQEANNLNGESLEQ